MNNNPNNNMNNNGRSPRPNSGDSKRQTKHPDNVNRQDGRPPVNQRPPMQNGRPPVNGGEYRRGNRTVETFEVKRNRPSQKNGNSLTKIAVIWVAVLALILVVILITAALRDDGDSGNTLPAGGTTVGTTDITTTEETTTFPVDHAEYTDDTSTFAADLSFANGILIDLENDTVVASRGGDSRIYPASMTKVMTLIVAAEAVENLDETFTMTAEITDPLYLANASVAGFLVGEQVTVRDLIYGLILPSGGDGALGLAYHIAGSEEAFAELMNKKAAELGLTNTHFTNCTGLHNDNHYSTCHEIALIVEYAIKDEFMREVLTTYQYTTEATPEHPEGILLTSTLLSRMSGDESTKMFVQGGKTGYTVEAKNCLASFATEIIPGLTEEQLKLQPTKYILVTAGSGEKFGPVFDAINVYKTFSGEDDGAVTADATVTAAPDPVEPEESETTKNPEQTKNTVKTEEETSTEKEPIKIYTAAPPS